HFDSDAQRDERAWTLGANSRLPVGVSVLWARRVHEDFHARFSARARRYRYVILNRAVRPALQARYVAWERWPLDADAMHEAARVLIGEHDFSAFRALSCQATHARREVLGISVWRESDQIILDIEANAFLHHMVRNIAGSLMEVGRGERPVEWIAQVLEKRDRALAGATAPPQGLTLMGPRYPPAWALPPEVTL
ncbi:MAG: tRNA pseudouridine(38-40) synthase TruA, partial [Rhodanobacteraceae bacterium]